jgi:hypothetical protein
MNTVELALAKSFLYFGVEFTSTELRFLLLVFLGIYSRVRSLQIKHSKFVQSSLGIFLFNIF